MRKITIYNRTIFDHIQSAKSLRLSAKATDFVIYIELLRSFNYPERQYHNNFECMCSIMGQQNSFVEDTIHVLNFKMLFNHLKSFTISLLDCILA